MTPTAEQKKAIDYPGSMVIIAKPGSGKTFVIAEKIRSILPVLPDYRGVIAISYTNKASAYQKLFIPSYRIFGVTILSATK